MGAQLLLLPLLFVFICISFLILQNFYQRWKMKEVMAKKREAAKISLVNIMQLTNSTVISPSWPRHHEHELHISTTDEADKNDLPTYNQLIASEGARGGEAISMGYLGTPRSPPMMSSVVTFREEQESPPPYEDLYDSRGKPQLHSVLFRYHNPCRGLVFPVSVSESSSSVSECKLPMEGEKKGGGGGVVSKSVGGGGGAGNFSQNNACLLQIPQQSTTQLEPDPSLERRNSSAVLYL